MPHLEPVDHDPFVQRPLTVLPVDHNPFDQAGGQMGSPDDIFAYGQGISKDATAANLLPAVELGLGMAPGFGEAMSARDAWDSSGRGAEALSSGDYGQAASEYLNMGTGLLGAIPGAGIVARGTKRGAAWMDRNLPAGVNKLMDAVYPNDPKNTLGANGLFDNNPYSGSLDKYANDYAPSERDISTPVSPPPYIPRGKAVSNEGQAVKTDQGAGGGIMADNPYAGTFGGYSDDVPNDLPGEGPLLDMNWQPGGIDVNSADFGRLKGRIEEIPSTVHGDYVVHRRVAGPYGPLEYSVSRRGGDYNPDEAGYYMAESSHPDVFASARVRLDGPSMAPVNVREDMQRKGIGSILYDAADDDLGVINQKLRPDMQTSPEADSFWTKRRNRNQSPANTMKTFSRPTGKSADIHEAISGSKKIGNGDFRLHGPSSDDTYQIYSRDGKLIGDINVGQMDDGAVMLGPRISPEYQRQGIATKVYGHIKDLASRSGLRLEKSDVRTPAGDALWQAIERRAKPPLEM